MVSPPQATLLPGRSGGTCSYFRSRVPAAGDRRSVESNSMSSSEIRFINRTRGGGGGHIVMNDIKRRTTGGGQPVEKPTPWPRGAAPVQGIHRALLASVRGGRRADSGV